MSLGEMRASKGQWAPGNPGYEGNPRNPTGLNQYNTPRGRSVARIDIAVDQRIESDPICAQDVADQVVAALKTLCEADSREIVKMFLGPGLLERVVSGAVDPGSGDEDRSSAQQILDIAAEFNVALPEGERATLASPSNGNGGTP